MNYQVEIRPPAQRDIAKAFDYYQDISPRLALRFTATLNRTFKIIGRRPEIFQKRYKMVRVALVEVFPFAIHFYIRENTVLIIGCFHTGMSPARWQQRLNS